MGLKSQLSPGDSDRTQQHNNIRLWNKAMYVH